MLNPSLGEAMIVDIIFNFTDITSATSKHRPSSAVQSSGSPWTWHACVTCTTKASGHPPFLESMAVVMPSSHERSPFHNSAGYTAKQSLHSPQPSQSGPHSPDCRFNLHDAGLSP